MLQLPHALRAELALAEPGHVEASTIAVSDEGEYSRETIEYAGLEGDRIPAFLFLPTTRPAGGVIVFHQHNGEFHLGKSEVAGVVGDPLQAFGPALARRGIAVLAPDAITFEERRPNAVGTAPDEQDWLQHYNAMAFRLIGGDLLMRKCMDDAQRAVSVLAHRTRIDPQRIGVFGHSYGGTTALYLAAMDPRCRFAGISGAVCSFETRQLNGTGIGMVELVPGIAQRIEVADLLASIAPRPVLVVSASADPYSQDADQVVSLLAPETVSEIRVDGGHALDQARFGGIVDWIEHQTQRST